MPPFIPALHIGLTAGANQERVVRSCAGRWSEAGEGRVVPAYASRHSSVTGGDCTGTLLYWLSSPCRTRPCPSLSTLLAKGQVRLGSREPSQRAEGQNPTLETVCPESTLHRASHQESAIVDRDGEKGDASGWILVDQCKLYMGRGSIRRSEEGAIVTQRARQGWLPRAGIGVGPVGWGEFEET